MSSIARYPNSAATMLRSPRQWRLQTKLIAIFVALLLLVQCLALVTYFVARGESRRIEAASALAVARTAAAAVDGFASNVEVAIRVQAQALGERSEPLDRGTVDTDLAKLQGAFEGTLRAVFVTDLDGRIIASPSGQQDGLDLSNRPFVQALRDGGESVWTGGIPGFETGTITVVHGRVIRGADEAPRGYLFAAMYPEQVMQHLPISLPEDGALTIIDHRGYVLYASDRLNLPVDQRDVSGAPGVREALDGSVFRIDGQPSPFAGDDRFGALVPIGRNGWVVGFTRSEAAIDAALDNRFRQQAVGYTIVMFVAVVLAIGIARRITLPLTRLAESAAAIARGERPRIVVPTADEEVRVLAEAIETMASAVADREENADFLAEASRLLASSLDYEVTLRNIGRLVVPRIADWYVVYALEETAGDCASKQLRPIAVAHADPRMGEIAAEVGRRYPTDPSPSMVLAEPLRTGKANVYPEITDEWLASLARDEEHLRLLRALGLTSAMVVPLNARGRTLGALVFVTAESGRRYRDDDLDVAEELANRIALAIDNARLYQDSQNALRREQDYARRLRGLADASVAVSAALTVDQTLRGVTERARELIGAHQASTCIVDALHPEDARFTVSVSPSYEAWREYFADPRALGVDALVAGSDSPVRLTRAELEAHPSWQVSRVAREGGPPIHGLLAAPLVGRDGRQIGFIQLSDKENGEFDSADEVVLAQLAHLASVAFEKAQLYQQIRDLNRSLEQRADELAAANRELEAFSYSVSHDLRAPLRAVDGFARILFEDHAAELSQEARHYLDAIGTSAKHMGALIDDLLTFSRLGRQPLKRQVVAPAGIVKQALEELQPELEGRRVQTIIGELPTCEADPSLLRLVFSNLISNALKFTRQREVAIVEVGSRIENGERVYFVRDNGVGFDMRYAHKLFGVFQRLHRAEDYEGTGVGLAIVQRIVHRHGGRVWAEAEPDRGATFSFTI